jgi:hypothetical protein
MKIKERCRTTLAPWVSLKRGLPKQPVRCDVQALCGHRRKSENKSKIEDTEDTEGVLVRQKFRDDGHGRCIIAISGLKLTGNRFKKELYLAIR